MSATCPTVTIDNGEGSPLIINESDFDPKVHKKFVARVQVKEDPPGGEGGTGGEGDKEKDKKQTKK